MVDTTTERLHSSRTHRIPAPQPCIGTGLIGLGVAGHHLAGTALSSIRRSRRSSYQKTHCGHACAAWNKAPRLGRSCQITLDEAVVFSGALSTAAEALFSHHVVGGTIILPGVGYVEMAFASSPGHPTLTAIAFLRPCSLSGPTDRSGERCALRCTQRGATLEIASRSLNAKYAPGQFVTNFVGTLVGQMVVHTTAKKINMSRTHRRISVASPGIATEG